MILSQKVFGLKVLGLKILDQKVLGQIILDQKVLDQKVLSQKVLGRMILDQKVLGLKIIGQKILDQSIPLILQMISTNFTRNFNQSSLNFTFQYQSLNSQNLSSSIQTQTRLHKRFPHDLSQTFFSLLQTLEFLFGNNKTQTSSMHFAKRKSSL